MLSFLAALTIGVVGMALYPFEHEPLFKDVTYKRISEHDVIYPAKDKKDCFELNNKKE